ncbi:hypothetical protein ACIQMJ_37545 [Actinosynnema sp. NPDC091369]
MDGLRPREASLDRLCPSDPVYDGYRLGEESLAGTQVEAGKQASEVKPCRILGHEGVGERVGAAVTGINRVLVS